MKILIVSSKRIAGAVRLAVLVALLGPLRRSRTRAAEPTQPSCRRRQLEPPAAAGAHKKDKTFFEVLKDGGIVMFLGAVSVYMLTLIIDSLRRIQNKVVCPPDIVNLLRSQFSAGDYNAAFQTCRSKGCF